MPKPKYVGEWGENRLFTPKDLAGMAQVAKLLADRAPMGKFVYVGVGRSPSVLMEFLRQAFKTEVFELPISISSKADSGAVVPYTKAVGRYINRFLPRAKLDGRGIVLIDFVDTGYSLDRVFDLMVEHLKLTHEYKVGKVLIAPLGILKNYLERPLSVLKDFDPDTRAAHRLLKVLHGQLDKEYFSPFGKITYEQINAGQLPLDKGQARNRLFRVMELALSTVDRSEYDTYLVKRKRPGRTLEDIFSAGLTAQDNALIRPAITRKLRLKSARYYKVSGGLTRYVAGTTLQVASANRFMTIVVVLLLLWLISSFWKTSEVSPLAVTAK